MSISVQPRQLRRRARPTIGAGFQTGGYIPPFRGSPYQYGGYIIPFYGAPMQYGGGIGFYRRQYGGGFVDAVKAFFKFFMPIVGPAIMSAGQSFLGNVSKGYEEGQSLKESAKAALKPALQEGVTKGAERVMDWSKKNPAGGRKRKAKTVYKGGQKKRKIIAKTVKRKKPKTAKRKKAKAAATSDKTHFNF